MSVVALLERLGAIGDRDGDSESTRLQHRFLVYMGTFMAGGGVLWGTIAAVHRLWVPMVVPWGYTLTTALNLAYFAKTKRFGEVRFLQVFISLLLPFLVQWSLGGLHASGVVMLWAMLAIVGAMTFSEARAVVGWLGLYCGLCVVSALVDEPARAAWAMPPNRVVENVFFLINIVVVSSLVFGLMIYLGFEREKVTRDLEAANRTITELNENLEGEVAARTRELHSALSRSKAILDNMADGLAAIDCHGVVQVANPALSRMLLLADSPSDRPAAEVLPAVFGELAARSIEANAPEKRDLALPGDHTGAAVASPIHAGAGAPDECVGSVVIVRDVTLEKEIDRMKSDFIATVSHELRTPLTSVLGFAKVTKSKLQTAVFPHVPEGDKKARKAVDVVSGNIDIIVSEGERLTSLINDVLDISKMEAGRMEWKMTPVAPGELVARAVEATTGLFHGEVALVKAIEPDLPELTGDRDRLLQVLINLVSNASKFTTRGSVTVAARRVDGGVELTVADTGAGIELADHETIFEKFRQVGDTLTNKPKGTGLGLPICKQIVQAHKGTIGVTSRVGAGSVFRVFLPVEGVAAAKPAAEDRDGAMGALLARIEHHVDQSLPGRVGGDVLVADDDANLRELLRQQLTERGYTVRQAVDGADAIREVRRHRPDLMILDIMMPGISGFDVAAVLKSDPETRGIPIIVLSIVPDSARGYGLGVDKYLTKPTEAEVLVGEVGRLMRQGSSPRRVLVVDEQMSAATDIVRLLEAKGYDVVGTCSAEQALAEARRSQPDLVVLDASLPRKDAIVEAVKLEKDLAHVYVVQLVSGTADAAG
jgi:signal transduction histidine kinase/DNA-binding response OmpR family regulator